MPGTVQPTRLLLVAVAVLRRTSSEYSLTTKTVQELDANLEAQHIGLAGLRQHHSDKLAHKNIKIKFLSLSSFCSDCLALFTFNRFWCALSLYRYCSVCFSLFCSILMAGVVVARFAPDDSSCPFLVFSFIIIYIVSCLSSSAALLSTAKWILFNSLTVSVDILLSIGLVASSTVYTAPDTQRIFTSWHWYPLASSKIMHVRALRTDRTDV